MWCLFYSCYYTSHCYFHWQKRGQAATQYLQELNEEASGEFIEEVRKTSNHLWGFRIATTFPMGVTSIKPGNLHVNVLNMVLVTLKERLNRFIRI